MIRLRVQEVARKQGIETIRDFAERAELAYDTAADYWHGRMKRVDLSTLERVCKTLKVEPGELIVLSDEAARLTLQFAPTCEASANWRTGAEAGCLLQTGEIPASAGCASGVPLRELVHRTKYSGSAVLCHTTTR